MILLNFTVEVHCLHLYPGLRYRLYSNNDLLIERNWRWGLNVHIEEDIWINLPFGLEHTIRIEQITAYTFPIFVFKNFKIATNHPIDVMSTTEHAIAFKI